MRTHFATFWTAWASMVGLAVVLGLAPAIEVHADAAPIGTAADKVGTPNALGPEHADTAASLDDLAGLYQSIGTYGKAEPLYQRALAIREKVLGPEHADTAQSLNNLAVLYREMGAYAKAEPLLQRALTIYERALGPEHPDTALSLNNLAALYRAKGAYGEAEPLYQRALAIREKALGPEHPDTATSLNNLANLYLDMGTYAKAEPLLQRALAIYEKALGPEDALTTTGLNNLAALYTHMGAYGKAEPLLQRALAIREKVLGVEHPDTALSLNNLAALYDAMGAYARAEALYQRALAITEKVLGAEHPDTARNLNNLAVLYQAMGAYAKAEPLYQRALAIDEKARGPEHALTAAGLNNLAALYCATGAYGKAEPLYQRALAIDEKARGPEHALTAAGLNNLAALYDAMGAYAKAEPLYQRALAIREKALGSEHADTATNLNNLAELYREMGAYGKAEPLYQRALAIDEKALGPEHPLTAVSLNNLAALYDAMGAYGKAEPLYQRALAIHEKVLGPGHPDTALSLNNLAALYDAMGAYGKAEPLYQRALAIAADGRSPEVLWSVQYGLSRINAKREAEAIFFDKQAVNTIQVMRGQVESLDKELQKSFLGDKTEVYRYLADLLSSQSRQAEALEVLLLLKQDELREYLKDSGDALRDRVTFTGVEIEWHRAYQDIAQRMAKIGAERAELDIKAKLGLTPQESARKSALDAQSQALKQELEAFLDRLRREGREQDEHAARTASAPAHIDKVEALQKSLRALGPGTVALHYLVTDEHVRVILTSADGQVGREAGISAKELNERIDELRGALQDRALDPRPLAKHLHDLLLAPLANDLERAGAQTLMLSLDSRLRYIPFAALYDGKQYLIERYRLSMLTAAGADAPADKRPWEVAGLGLTQAVTVEAGLPPKITRFAALPSVKAELQAIVKTDHSEGVLPGIIKLDEAFTEEALAGALARPYPVLHLATHFNFLPGSADASYLVLGNGQPLPLGKLNSGAFDFSAVDLLALSACETAMGGERNADGREIESFGALARLKGAQSVLASLWEVDDTSTATLMSRFYAKHQDGLSKAEALRRAQLEMLRGQVQVAEPNVTRKGSSGERAGAQQTAEAPRFVSDPERPYAHPYYWAPFILMGNWL